jgi:hypothetical protein
MQQGSNPSSLAEPESQNQDQALLNQDVAQESRSAHSADNLDYPAIRESNMPSQSRPDGHVQEGDVLLPEAIPVETNAPVEDPGVVVAELVQPDQSRFRFKKIMLVLCLHSLQLFFLHWD